MSMQIAIARAFLEASRLHIEAFQVISESEGGYHTRSFRECAEEAVRKQTHLEGAEDIFVSAVVALEESDNRDWATAILHETKPGIYRIEHAETFLGPYEHNGQIPAVMYHGIHNTQSTAGTDWVLSGKSKVVMLEKTGAWGFIKFEQTLRMLKNMAVLAKHGFVIRHYSDVEIVETFEDGQVIFIHPMFKKEAV